MPAERERLQPKRLQEVLDGLRPEARYELSRDSTVSIVARGEYCHVDAEISDSSIERIAKVGEVPVELRATMASSLQMMLCDRVLLLDRRSTWAWRTRTQLRDELSAIRSKASRGKLPDVPPQLRLELRALEYRRRTGTPHGPPPPPIRLAEVERWTATFHVVNEYVAACFREPAALARLADDALNFLVTCGVTTQEAFASKSGFSPEKDIAFGWCFDFWTRDLGRPPKITKQLVAFTDAVLRLNGFRLEESAIRKHLYERRKTSRSSR
jgi:hypothetical protein